MAISRMLGRTKSDTPPANDPKIHLVMAVAGTNIDFFRGHIKEPLKFEVIINDQKTDQVCNSLTFAANDRVIIKRKSTKVQFEYFYPGNVNEGKLDYIKQIVEPLPEMYNGDRVEHWFRNMFKDLYYLEQVPAPLFAVPNRAPYPCDLYRMFQSCSNLTAIPEGLLDCFPVVSNIENMFAWCRKVTSVPRDLFRVAGKYVTMGRGAFMVTSITEIPQGFLDSFGNLENANSMFGSCKITKVPEYLFCYCRELRDVSMIFSGNPLTSVPEKLFWEAMRIENFARAFAYCNLLEISDEIFYSAPKATDFQGVFEGNENLALGSINSSAIIHLFLYSDVITNVSNAFQGCNVISTDTPGPSSITRLHFGFVSPNITNATNFISSAMLTGKDSIDIDVPCTDGTSQSLQTFKNTFAADQYFNIYCNS